MCSTGAGVTACFKLASMSSWLLPWSGWASSSVNRVLRYVLGNTKKPHLPLPYCLKNSVVMGSTHQIQPWWGNSVDVLIRQVSNEWWDTSWVTPRCLIAHYYPCCVKTVWWWWEILISYDKETRLMSWCSLQAPNEWWDTSWVTPRSLIAHFYIA
jgi:hypothetical protein